MTTLLGKAMFECPWWAVLVNPYYLPRRGLWRAMREVAHVIKGRVLDVGCGTQPYRALLTSAESIIGLELDTERNRSRALADAFYDGQTLPFADESLQTVLCNQVLEHVFRPDDFLAEIHRVLAPNGVLVLSVPFVWPEHEQPQDSQRYCSFGLKHVVERSGLEVTELRKLGRGMTAVCAVLADQVNGILRPLPSLVRVAFRFSLICPITLIGILAESVAPRDSGFYLDNFLVARKPEAAESL